MPIRRGAAALLVLAFAATPAASAQASGPNIYLRDWIYLVGQDIPPGAYATTAGNRPCYWARLRSFGEGARSILAEDNLEPGEYARVVVQPTDRGFKVSNGCTWYPDQG